MSKHTRRHITDSPPKTKQEMEEAIVRQLARRHVTAVVLLHHALAELLGVGPTDLQCLDLLREHGKLTGSELAAITGLTTGAITGVVARLERAGFLRREADAHDKRKQILYPSLEPIGEIRQVFEPLHKDVMDLLAGFDRHQLAAITEYLARSRDLAYRHMALLRCQKLSASTGTRRISQLTTPRRSAK